MSRTVSELTKIQKERLAHIEFKAYFFGSVGRKDLIERFGIKDAAATRDFTKYNEMAPDNLRYDTSNRHYSPSETFKPLFNYSINRVLSTMSEGFGDGLKENYDTGSLCVSPYQLNQPNINIISVLTRAIKTNRVIAITYNSISSGKTTRQIIPFALVDNGLRWHVRAWDRKRERFTDFVVTRIENADFTKETVLDHEKKEQDKHWNELVEIELIAHPSISNRRTIEIDYGMDKGILKLKIRKAILGYVLRRWNVDCSPTHSLKGLEYHLALREPSSIKYNIDTMALAPGFKTNS